LSFLNIWEKFPFESKLKKHRDEQTLLGNKTFFFSILTPHGVLPELLWKTDQKAVKKAAYARVKTKCVPRLDP
jgi:hypothetical protein